ncbi:MAG: 30S ribosomal protein S6 [Bacteroidota bacterium]|jgi:small subunit ribosomal protein S6
MLNNYETVFILTPVLSEDQAKETVNRYKEYLKSNGVSMVHDENWGLRKLAYPINKKTSGFYVLFQYQAPATFVNEFELSFRRDERVIRFLTVKLDKFALEYAQRRITRKAEKKEVTA